MVIMPYDGCKFVICEGNNVSSAQHGIKGR